MNRSERRRQEKLARKSRDTPKPAPSIPAAANPQAPAIRHAIDQGMAHHGAGRLPEAEALYNQVLQIDPDQPEALHLLGVIAHQVGKNDTAVTLIGRAIARQPDYPAAHNNLGIALKELGRFAEAEAMYRQALVLKPDYAEAFSNLGVALKEQGKLDEAVINFRQSIALKADAEVHNNLGNTLEIIGDLDAAIAHQRQALALNPDYPGALNSLANALKEHGDFDAAATCFEKSLALLPDPGVHTNLGCMLNDLGRPDEALACHTKAIGLNPDYAEAHYNLGNSLRDLGRLNEAAASYQQATTLKPDLAEAHHNLGVVLQDLNRLDEAVASYRKALAINPDYAEAHRGLGYAQLLRGELEKGWENYAWRWKTRDYRDAKRTYDAADWDGGEFTGKTLFLYREQGLGDFIQFARYVPLAAAKGGRVIVEAPPKLRGLFAAIDGADAVIETGQPPGAFDFHASLMDLPLLLGTGPATIPAPASYVGVEPERVRRWQARLAGYGGLRVGINWAGNPDHKADRHRSFAPELLQPLVDLPDLSVFSLQVGCDGVAVDNFSDRVIDLAPEVIDFADLAAAMINLDLIISIDSAPAHLAGALGRPVWTLLSFLPDWRWMLDRDDSPWYPSMRLFRQHRAGDWGAVIDHVRRDLAAAAAAGLK